MVRSPLHRQAGMPLLEWLVGALGAVLVLGTIGYMTWLGIRADGGPPDVEVRVEGVFDLSHGHLVRVRAVNHGAKTAAQTTVEGELRDAGGVVETSEIVFDYLPAGSEREGGLFFTRNPRHYQLDVRPWGYTEP